MKHRLSNEENAEWTRSSSMFPPVLLLLEVKGGGADNSVEVEDPVASWVGISLSQLVSQEKIAFVVQIGKSQRA